MTFTKHFLIIFLTISLFVFTFFDTQGGYLFFANAFPVALILTCVVFIEELFKPTKKKSYIDDTQKQIDATGVKGLSITFLTCLTLLIITVVFSKTSAIVLKSVLFPLFFIVAYLLYRTVQKYTYHHMTTSIQRRITPINLIIIILFSTTFGMFYYKAVYLPKSADLLVKKNEYQFLNETALKYSEIDSMLAVTRGKADTDEPLDTLEILYSAYIEKIGGAKVSRDNVLEFAVFDWEDAICESAYRKLIAPEYTATLENRVLTLKFNAFFYGLSGNIYRDLNQYEGQFDKLVYDLSNCRGGDLQQALYATDPIFPIDIVARIETNENRRSINTQVFSSTDYMIDADIEVIVSEDTSNLGGWAAANANALGYNIIGETREINPKIYEMLYVKELNQFYVFPIGKLTGLKTTNASLSLH
ncbi:hypothetical protein [Fusibacter sp. 3D3]|uniref:hypothetical protein n=1 Tax=Fusibacter sp. 3D3 TaxID=1048380 RepID=UPI000853D8AF|nr:hypothetical protein [Fusibacter sp. 3D3]GAU77984.1 hypothetical protein F3D3_2613 [Fusibacter sp. 3D3]